jgi:hypothetical protein
VTIATIALTFGAIVYAIWQLVDLRRARRRLEALLVEIERWRRE